MRSDRRTDRRLRTIGGLALAAGLLAAGLSATPCHAASIPAWLDEAISGWNKDHADLPIRFIAIRDSYVWYTMPATPELASKDIRERVYSIALKNGYAMTSDEESVTTATPPSAKGPPKMLKCWNRSFLRDTQSGNTGGGQRMLTTMVCDAQGSWTAGFRVLQ